MHVGAAGDFGRPGGSFYRLDVKSGTFTPLFPRNTPERIRSPIGAVSTDGKTMYLFAREHAKAAWTTISGIDLATGTERLVAALSTNGLPPETQILALAISPDNSALAAEVLALPNTRVRLIVVRTDGTRDWEAHNFPMTSGAPPSIAWTPDSRSILFGDDRSGAWQVLRVPAGGGSVEPDSVDLSKLRGPIEVPRVRPSGGGGAVSLNRDGSRIAFVASRLPTYELWSVDILSARNGR